MGATPILSTGFAAINETSASREKTANRTVGVRRSDASMGGHIGAVLSLRKRRRRDGHREFNPAEPRLQGVFDHQGRRHRDQKGAASVDAGRDREARSRDRGAEEA